MPQILYCWTSSCLRVVRFHSAQNVCLPTGAHTGDGFVFAASPGGSVSEEVCDGTTCCDEVEEKRCGDVGVCRSAFLACRWRGMTDERRVHARDEHPAPTEYEFGVYGL